MRSEKWYGFTLAELLIALAILGVIATFTIPKILSTQQNSKYNASAHEVAGMLASAYTMYVRDNGYSTSTNQSSLTPYLNYVAVDTVSWADDRPGWPGTQCSATWKCYRLHNGGILWYQNYSFPGSSSTDNIYINFDPDAANQIAGSGVQFNIYYNGRISTPTSNPTWFSW